MLRKPGIKEIVFDRSGEVFHCFDCQRVCRKMTEKLIRAMCWSLGDLSSMVRNRFTDLLKHYFIVVKEEQIFIMQPSDITIVDRFLVARKPALSAMIPSDRRSHESHKRSYKSWCDQRSFFLQVALAGLEVLVEMQNQYFFGYVCLKFNLHL